jgi:hypothetical protein
MHRIFCALVVLIALAVGARVAAAAPPAGEIGPPSPLPPEAAAALSHAPPQLTQGPTIRATAAQALAAAKQAGAKQEGNPGGGDPCWQNTWSVQFGYWPYHQIVNLTTYWCSDWLGGPLSYRSSNTTLDGLLCGWSNPYDYRVSGGLGYTTVTVEGGGDFACQTAVPWIVYHYHRWERIEYSTWGGSWAVAWG